jgi:HK97 family phage prohead protease
MSEQPAGALRYRQARQLGVSFPDRTIELIVMPYDEETLVGHPTEDRSIIEVCAPGAFNGIERRANRIRVNRDHDVARTVGRAVSFSPGRPEGLVAKIKIANTSLGDETLELAHDECLDASAGFLPLPGGETWETRSRVRLTKCWLGHIAMTPEPAYGGAKVLAVRSAEPVSGTPNLDRIREMMLADSLAARYPGLL